MSATETKLRLTVGGAVNPRTSVYIIRPSDDELLALLERGEYCNVLCSRQMGKTSLLKRTRARLDERGYATAEIEVAGLLGSPKDADEWYQGLLDEIARQLRLPVNVPDWWRATTAVTANQKLIRFFREEVIAKVPGDKPVIIFLDEIDSTLKLPYTDDFFVAIRAMYNDCASDPVNERIAFCLVGVATPNELIKERRTTPYNIGRTIELQDFDTDRDDLGPIYRSLCEDETLGEATAREVIRQTGGHPYLSLRVCDELSARPSVSPADVAAVVERTFGSLDSLKSDVHFDQMLRFLNERVDDKLSTLDLYRRVIGGKPVPDQTTPAHINLKLIGLVKRDGHGNLALRNPIYQRLFTDAWAKSQLGPGGSKQHLKIVTITVIVLFIVPLLLLYLAAITNPPVQDSSSINVVAFSPDGQKVLTGSYNHTARLWSAEDGKPIGEPMRHSDWVLAAIFSPDGRTVLTSSYDHTARLWSAEDGKPIGEPMKHDRGVLSVAFSPDGRTVLTGSDDYTAQLWSAQDDKPIGEPMQHKSSVLTVAFSPDGRTVLTGSSDGTARFWSAKTGKPIGEPMRHSDWVRTVAVSPDGRTVLTGSDDHTARLWRAEDGKPIGEPIRHGEEVLAVAFSPDGRTILTGGKDQIARLWSAEDSTPIGVPMRHGDWVRAVVFSQDGRTVLTGSEDHTARLWSAQDGKPIGEPMRHDQGVRAVAFSPDGSKVLTGSSDETARLWSAQDGKPIGEAMRHTAWVQAVAFSPDERLAVAATRQWLHKARADGGGGLPPVLRRLLPGTWPAASKPQFLTGAEVRIGVLPTGDSLRVARLRLDRPDAEPIQGDPAQLLADWQRRLGLKINDAGEIVPRW